MLSQLPLLLTLLTTSSALTISRSSPSSKILADLQIINANYLALRDADFQFGRDGDAVNVQTKVTAINLSNELTTVDAGLLSSPLTSSQTQDIIDYINSTLEPSIKSEIEAAIAQKAKVASEGLTAAVALEMTQLKIENDNVGAAIETKVQDGGQVEELRKAIGKIDADYAVGIGAFSS